MRPTAGSAFSIALFTRVAVCFVIFLIPGPSNAKLIASEGPKSVRGALELTGDITQADAAALQEIFANHSNHSFSVILLNSNGGDVLASMQIGRLVRKNRVTTAVPINAHCLSSCALVYIGGLYRINVGTIGLHRPYLAGEPKSEAEVEKAVLLMNLSVRNYVSEMGITQEFSNTMANTPPESMKIFRGREIQSIVPGRDPLDEEIEIADQARQRGITTQAYRRRQFDAQEECAVIADIENQYECLEAGTWGLSRSEYRRRFDDSGKECEFSKSERLAIHEWANGGKPIEENTEFLRHEKCLRPVMAGRQP